MLLRVEPAGLVGYHPPFPSHPPRSPALEICALASGSKGNAVYVGSDGRGVLVDVGLAAGEVERRLGAVGLGPDRVAAVVVTHEHRDHVRGVGAWGRRYRVPVYMTEPCRCRVETVLAGPGLRNVDVRPFEPGVPFEVGGLELRPVDSCHDAAEPVGFRISDGAAALGFATDLGFASHPVREALRGVDLLYLESNHDVDRLWNGPYPWPLKQRIRSRHGHLSNDACAELVADLLHPHLETVILGHLSETNNEPRLAFEATARVLRHAGAAGDVTLLVARQDRPGRRVASRRTPREPVR